MKTDERVIIQNTGSELDGAKGKILGLSTDTVVRFWIVGLDLPYLDERGTWRAITIPETCLRRE